MALRGRPSTTNAIVDSNVYMGEIETNQCEQLNFLYSAFSEASSETKVVTVASSIKCFTASVGSKAIKSNVHPLGKKVKSDNWRLVVSRPPQLFIDSLVSRLKRTNRWALDGRSLRQLNRFWCSQTNNHIEAVNPHESRLVVPTESLALLKFPNLTSLDADVFMAELYDDDYARLPDLISSLTSLKHLSVTKIDSNFVDSSCLSSLTRLTSLWMKQEIESRGVYERLTQLHLLKLKCACSFADLQHMATWFTSLKHLDETLTRGA